MKKAYPSAVDAWLAVILVGVPLAVIVFGAWTLSHSLAAGFVTLFSGLLMGGLIAAFSRPCVYTLSDENLHIQCGVWEEAVPLARIKSAELSSSAWSAPALSLRRVKIALTDGGERVISPRDRDRFIADLTARLTSPSRQS